MSEFESKVIELLESISSKLDNIESECYGTKYECSSIASNTNEVDTDIRNDLRSIKEMLEVR